MALAEDVSYVEQVTQYLNSYAVAQETSEKISYFLKVREILLKKAPTLLPKFLQTILNFTNERNADLKKALVEFIEELVRLQEFCIPKVMLHLHMLLWDESVVVQKRVIQSATTIYRRTLAWLCKAPTTTGEMKEAWKQLSAIKLDISSMTDSDNDGLRTSSIKFLESVILLQSYPDGTESKRPDNFSLNDVPSALEVVNRRRLGEEAETLFEELVNFHGSSHISGPNLLVCIGVLSNIARSRGVFMVRVVRALGSLFSNLPPTLTTTQMGSVNKKLKSELSRLVQCPSSYECIGPITPILLKLGCSQSEINMLVPKNEEPQNSKKRGLSPDSVVQQRAKRARPLEHTSFKFNERQPLILVANRQFILSKPNFKKVVSIPEVPHSVPTNSMKNYAEFVKVEHIDKIPLEDVVFNYVPDSYESK